MSYEYRELVFTVKELAGEITAACDAYKRREISAGRLKEIILAYASAYPDKLFNGTDINPTIKAIIGKKRIALLNTMLDGFQPSMFGGGKYGS